MSEFIVVHCRDVLAIGLLDVFTCVLAGFAIFSILGYLAHNQGKDVHDVVKEGLFNKESVI
ncbi:hypothetical protein DPMN_005506 [Dreissena polymorpha]|uniref:Uncharacterized protein n=1 Tax=Dreissena polymorpha TaxID=45954 RepID=A0A9D4RWK1_DREPO|nr:hypothetical protein DPMN_005506 [Dreissena polymorpha]